MRTEDHHGAGCWWTFKSFVSFRQPLTRLRALGRSSHAPPANYRTHPDLAPDSAATKKWDITQALHFSHQMKLATRFSMEHFGLGSSGSDARNASPPPSPSVSLARLPRTQVSSPGWPGKHRVSTSPSSSVLQLARTLQRTLHSTAIQMPGTQKAIQRNAQPPPKRGVARNGRRQSRRRAEAARGEVMPKPGACSRASGCRTPARPRAGQ